MKVTCKKEIQRLVAKGLISKRQIPVINEVLNSSKKNSQEYNNEERLYQLLLPIYGDYFNDTNGQLVKELKVLPNRKFRLDVALVYSRCIVEVDGVIGHSTYFDQHSGKNIPNIEGFKRDRTRDMLLATQGWLTIRCLGYHIDKEPQLIIDAVAAIVAKQEKLPINISKDHGAYPAVI